MKKLVVLLLAAVLLFGCTSNSEVSEPSAQIVEIHHPIIGCWDTTNWQYESSGWNLLTIFWDDNNVTLISSGPELGELYFYGFWTEENSTSVKMALVDEETGSIAVWDYTTHNAKTDTIFSHTAPDEIFKRTTCPEDVDLN